MKNRPFLQHLRASISAHRSKLLNEAYTIIEGDNDLWLCGTTSKRMQMEDGGEAFTPGFTKPDEPFQPVVTTFADPLFFSNDPRLAKHYIEMHTAADFSKNNRSLPQFQEALHRENDTFALAVKVSPNAHLMDISKRIDPSGLTHDDYVALGLDPKYALVFKDCEPYYAFNTHVTFNIDNRPEEFLIAVKWLRWKLATDGIYAKDKLKKPDELYSSAHSLSQLGIILKAAKAHIKFDKSSYESFYGNYTSQFDGLELNADGHPLKPGTSLNTDCNFLKHGYEPENISHESLDIIETYIELFAEFAAFAASKGFTTAASMKQSPLVAAAAELMGKDTVTLSRNVDPLQFFLNWKISEKFDGVYCPESKGAKMIDGLKVVGDTIELFSTKHITKSLAVSWMTINEFIEEGNDVQEAAELGALCRKLLDFNGARKLRIEKEKIQKKLEPIRMSIQFKMHDVMHGDASNAGLFDFASSESARSLRNTVVDMLKQCWTESEIEECFELFNMEFEEIRETAFKEVQKAAAEKIQKIEHNPNSLKCAKALDDGCNACYAATSFRQLEKAFYSAKKAVDEYNEERKAANEKRIAAHKRAIADELRRYRLFEVVYMPPNAASKRIAAVMAPSQRDVVSFFKSTKLASPSLYIEVREISMSDLIRSSRYSTYTVLPCTKLVAQMHSIDDTVYSIKMISKEL